MRTVFSPFLFQIFQPEGLAPRPRAFRPRCRTQPPVSGARGLAGPGQRLLREVQQVLEMDGRGQEEDLRSRGRRKQGERETDGRRISCTVIIVAWGEGEDLGLHGGLNTHSQGQGQFSAISTICPLKQCVLVPPTLLEFRWTRLMSVNSTLARCLN